MIKKENARPVSEKEALSRGISPPDRSAGPGAGALTLDHALCEANLAARPWVAG